MVLFEEMVTMVEMVILVEHLDLWVELVVPHLINDLLMQIYDEQMV